MSRIDEKRAAGIAALRYVEPGSVVGVGTGSTVAFFIAALAGMKRDIDGAVASSEQTAERLKAHGIRVYDLNAAGPLPLYVDGADECDAHRRLIKGGGGALTREKICAAASERFVCIVDSGKCVDVLGRFPLPIEVIPMARSQVARELILRGGQPVWRDGAVTDNGNWIIDLHGLRIIDPVKTERELNQIAGIVSVGLFAQRCADIVLVGERELATASDDEVSQTATNRV